MLCICCTVSVHPMRTVLSVSSLVDVLQHRCVKVVLLQLFVSKMERGCYHQKPNILNVVW